MKAREASAGLDIAGGFVGQDGRLLATYVITPGVG
jgi:hypothetical protein